MSLDLFDVNIFVYAADGDSPHHAGVANWLQTRIASPEPFAISELVLSGFMRIATNPRVLKQPLSTQAALEFIGDLRSLPHCLSLQPGERHWEIFADLCRQINARGNDVPDAYHAALAIEHDCEWITADRGFARFPGLRWRHPLDD